jgi:hypothetical protein
VLCIKLMYTYLMSIVEMLASNVNLSRSTVCSSSVLGVYCRLDQYNIMLF